MKRLILILCMLLLSFNAIQQEVDAQNPVALSVEGPRAFTPGQQGSYFVNVTGGPAEHNGTYKLKYWIEGPDTTGAEPLVGAPGTASSSNNTFLVNVTAPSVETEFLFIIEATSENNTLNSSARETITVNVLGPLVLTASFSNSGGAVAVNVTVRFYIDEEFIGSRVINRINPGERGTATLNWIPVGLQPGQHTIIVEADIDKDGSIDPSKGEVVTWDIFFRTGGELATGYLIILGVLIVLIGIVLLMAIRRRRKLRG